MDIDFLRSNSNSVFSIRAEHLSETNMFKEEKAGRERSTEVCLCIQISGNLNKYKYETLIY